MSANKLIPVLFFALIVGSAFGAATPVSDKQSDVRYLNKAELGAVIGALQGLQYPLTRPETLELLKLTDRHLPSVKTFNSESAANPGLLTQEHESISLTSSEKDGRRYRLVLWYDPSARKTSSESFPKAKIINYAEIIVEDDGTGDAPKAVYVVQSFRYPYSRLEYARRTQAGK